MKKFYAILCLAIASLTQLQAQTPQGFNYQATVRNSAGDLIVNTNVYFKFNVIQGTQTSVPIFTETHYVPTDDLGQVNLVIGQGTANTGIFSELDWSLGNYYLGIELNTGNGYIAMGTTQLLSVPYALYAESSGSSTPNTPWTVDTNNDNINYDKKVVIGSLTNQNVPPLEVYASNTGGTSPSANFIRSRYRNNTLLFTTSEDDNNYTGSIGLIEAGENNEWPNSFVIGINDGLQWYNPLRIYYDNKALRFGFGSDTYSDPNSYGESSLSLGFNTFVSGNYSTALGVDNIASGLNSTALGINSKASAQGAVVLGVNSLASGTNSTAIGLNSNAVGSGSTALGLNATATGDFSNAFGVDIEAQSFAETVVGRYNTSYTPIGGVDGYDIDDRMFVVGNGQSDTDRSDALIIKKSGEMSLEGNQIKNLKDPTDPQDAVTVMFLMEKISELQDQIDNLKVATRSGSVTDQDGYIYDYLTYGDQVWTVENAEVVTYRDGTEIPQVTDPIQWSNLTTGAWCYYNNDPTKGKLYNWYAVMGIHDNDESTPDKEFAPQGWHVPTNAEWTALKEYLITNGYNYDGTTTENKIAKAMASTTGWNSSGNTTGSPGNDQRSNNSSGFNAFPLGLRDVSGTFSRGDVNAIFWSSTEFSTSLAWYGYLNTNDNRLFIYGSTGFSNSKHYGFSMRFVKGSSPYDIDNDNDGYTENQGDCDDNNPEVNPRVTEILDGIDNDCDGEIDEIPKELISKLYGFDPANPNAVSSRTWKIQSAKPGHFGLGPVAGSFPTEWYGAGPGEKADVGMYDDRFIFSSDGTYQHVTNGDVFGRDPHIVNDLGANTSGAVDGADILNFAYADYTGSFTLTAPGGVETISLSDKGFIGYYTGGNHSYEIFDRGTPNEMILRTTDAASDFDWWFILVLE